VDLEVQVGQEVQAEVRMGGVRELDPVERMALPVQWVTLERMVPLDRTAISSS